MPNRLSARYYRDRFLINQILKNLINLLLDNSVGPYSFATSVLMDPSDLVNYVSYNNSNSIVVK